MAVTNKIFFPTFISSINYEPVRTLPHIYFYNGLKDCETYYIAGYDLPNTGSVLRYAQSSFPYYDYYDGVIPNTDSNSLLFFNELPAYGDTPTRSLYTEYWETYVSLLYNPRTRLFKASAIIPLADYFEMELNDIVQWRGNYYHLRAINDYNLVNGTCNIELLGPIIRDAVDRVPTPVPPGPPEFCVFELSSSYEGVAPPSEWVGFNSQSMGWPFTSSAAACNDQSPQRPYDTTNPSNYLEAGVDYVYEYGTTTPFFSSGSWLPIRNVTGPGPWQAIRTDINGLVTDVVPC